MRSLSKSYTETFIMFILKYTVKCIRNEKQDSSNISEKLMDFQFHDRNSSIDSARVVIFPGTKWCGVGTTASNYNDLGQFKRVDSCCRDHDNCPDYISPFTTKYGLRNYTPVYKIQCSCDLKFHQCLKSIGSTAANNIGNIYFNNAENKCFKQDHPIIACKVAYQSSSRRCKEYLLNTNQQKKYQFFDIPPY